MKDLFNLLKEVFGSGIPKNKIDIYDARSMKWKKVVYRPVVKTSCKDCIEAMARSRFGMNPSEEDIKKAEEEFYGYDSTPVYVDIVIYSEGGFLLSDNPESLVHAFVHANLIGKYGIAKEAAKLEAKFYKTGKKKYLENSLEIFSLYHEFDEVCTKAMEAIFFDSINDEKNLKRILKNWKFLNDEKHQGAIHMYHLYKQIGLKNFLRKVENLMKDKEKISMIFS
jgi:hypothetical protein